MRRRENPLNALGTHSVVEVLDDAAFEHVEDQDGGTYPGTILCVVRHRATGLLYACRYRIYDDYSDAGEGQRWFRVECVEVRRTEYKEVKR